MQRGEERGPQPDVVIESTLEKWGGGRRQLPTHASKYVLFVCPWLRRVKIFPSSSKIRRRERRANKERNRRNSPALGNSCANSSEFSGFGDLGRRGKTMTLLSRAAAAAATDSA